MCTAGSRITTFGALRIEGLSRRRIRARLDDGSLCVLRRGIYAESGVCGPRRVAAQHGGTLGCVSAARHLGLWTLSGDADTHVWLQGHGHRRHPDGCGCVEHWDDSEARDGFGLPSVPRILRQILLCRGAEEFFVALESALHQDLLTRAGLAWLRTHAGPAGRDAIAFARGEAESGLESLVRWRLRETGIRIRAQVRILAVGRVDFLLGDRLIVEVDGVENHDGASHRHKDLVRDSEAAAWGYITLRFDYALVVHDWPAVEAAILSYVARGLHLRA